MNRLRRPLRRGFTLVELSVGVLIGILVAAMVLVLLNQQLAFVRIYSAQNFLTQEAPIISTYMNRLIGQADRYRLHRNRAEAITGANPVLADATALRLNFQQPDGTSRSAILCFENRGTGNALYYYLVPLVGAPADPQWAVSKQPTNVRFSIENGILRTRLTGPAGEQIIYSGTMQQ